MSVFVLSVRPFFLYVYVVCMSVGRSLRGCTSVRPWVWITMCLCVGLSVWPFYSVFMMSACFRCFYVHVFCFLSICVCVSCCIYVKDACLSASSCCLFFWVSVGRRCLCVQDSQLAETQSLRVQLQHVTDRSRGQIKELETQKSELQTQNSSLRAQLAKTQVHMHGIISVGIKMWGVNRCVL